MVTPVGCALSSARATGQRWNLLDDESILLQGVAKVVLARDMEISLDEHLLGLVLHGFVSTCQVVDPLDIITNLRCLLGVYSLWNQSP